MDDFRFQSSCSSSTQLICPTYIFPHLAFYLFFANCFYWIWTKCVKSVAPAENSSFSFVWKLLSWPKRVSSFSISPIFSWSTIFSFVFRWLILLNLSHAESLPLWDHLQTRFYVQPAFLPLFADMSAFFFWFLVLLETHTHTHLTKNSWFEFVFKFGLYDHTQSILSWIRCHQINSKNYWFLVIDWFLFWKCLDLKCKPFDFIRFYSISSPNRADHFPIQKDRFGRVTLDFLSFPLPPLLTPPHSCPVSRSTDGLLTVSGWIQNEVTSSPSFPFVYRFPRFNLA